MGDIAGIHTHVISRQSVWGFAIRIAQLPKIVTIGCGNGNPKFDYVAHGGHYMALSRCLASLLMPPDSRSSRLKFERKA